MKARTTAKRSEQERPIAVVGVPFNSAGVAGGVAGMSAAVRRAGLISRLESLGKTIIDAGDVEVAEPISERDAGTGLVNFSALEAMIHSVKQTTSGLLECNRFPVLLGGDCALLLGALSALEGHVERRGLMFVDGHEDAWPPSRSPTGEASDSELGIALGLTPGVLPGSLVRSETITVIGPRDRDELDAEGIPSLASSVWFRDADRVASVGASAVAEAATEHLRARTDGWWLHTDLDVLSSAALPAVDYPQQGGLSWEQLSAIIATALRNPRCVGWSVAIYNPDLDGGSAASRISEFIQDGLRRLD